MSDSIETIDWIADSPAAARALAARDDVALERLSDDAIRITVKARPREVMKLVVACATFGAVAVALGFLGERYRWFDDVPLRSARHPLLTFGGLGALLIATSFLILLMTAVNGPDRDTVLEVRPGRITIDRYMAGDHVVREYSADEVKSLVVEMGSITVRTRRDMFSIAPTADRQVCVPIITLVAQGLWLDNAGIAQWKGKIVAAPVAREDEPL